MATEAKKTEPIEPSEVVDILLLVYGGGGCFGLPDPDPEEMLKIISVWSQEQMRQVVDYAAAVYAVAGDNAGVKIPPKPNALDCLCRELNCQFA